MADFDILFAGGGLASCLTALRLSQLRPGLRVAIVDPGERLGGDHVWSSFDADITPDQRAWTGALYEARWPGYSVAFPAFGRRVAMGYASATSTRLDAAVWPAAAHIRAEVTDIAPRFVTLAGGSRLEAGAVIDGRGARESAHLDLRWQKFAGIEVALDADHGLAEPVVMDATVPQTDGYRFVYLLPFGPRRLLIEDTYYSDGPDLDAATLDARIRAYAGAKGWRIASVARGESGVLPVALGGDIDAFWAEAPAGVPRIGLRAALFHPTTGYSFPDAVRTADLIAGLPSLDPASIDRAVRAMSIAAWRERGFYRMLDRMLFLAAEPDQRYRVLQRFYGLSEPLIARFYAGRSTLADKARILAGKPPVPIGRALAAMRA